MSWMVMVAMVLTLAACSGGTPASTAKTDSATTNSSGNKADSTPVATATGNNEKITLKFLYIWPEHKTVMEKTISDFEDQHPNIKVEISVTPWDKVTQQMQTSIASGEAPDVAFMFPSTIGSFVSLGAALDLTPYMDDDWKSRFLSEDELKVGKVDGKLYNVPFRGTATYVAYNQDLFEKNGWKEPQTQEELVKIMDDMLSKGIAPFAIPGKPDGFQISAVNDYFVKYNLLADGSVTDPQYVKARKTDIKGPYAEAFKKTKEWYTKGYFGKSPEAVGREQAQALFFQQRAAMSFLNNNELVDLRKGTEGKFKLGFMVFPKTANASETILGGGFDGFFAYAKSKYPKESVELLKWLTSKEAQGPWANDAMSAMTVKGIEYKDKDLAKFASFMGIAGKYNQYPDYNQGNVNTINGQQMVNFLQGKMTAEQLEQTWNDNIKKQIADAGK
jgi:raffinose/stachyose/melibiose transport system substrate-binding protein